MKSFGIYQKTWLELEMQRLKSKLDRDRQCLDLGFRI